MASLLRLRILFYISVIAMHISNIFYMSWVGRQNKDRNENVIAFKDLEYRFFTTWTYILQIGYSILGLVCDILLLMNSGKKNYALPQPVSEFREIVFAGLVWPSTLVVFTVFWGLYAYDSLFFTFKERGVWLYPIFKRAYGTIYFPLALTTVGFLFFIFYYTQWPLTRMLHGSNKKKEQPKKKEGVDKKKKNK